MKNIDIKMEQKKIVDEELQRIYNIIIYRLAFDYESLVCVHLIWIYIYTF